MEGIMCNIRRIIIGQLLIIYLSGSLTLAADDRFMDNGDGTVTDSVSTLVWLKNAGCTETVGGVSSYYFTWANAFIWTNSLASGNCGLTDHSTAGHWRLPTIAEMQSLGPSLPPATPPFTNTKGNYWSSESGSDTCAKVFNLGSGTIYCFSKDPAVGWAYIWPVSGGRVLTITKAGPGDGTVTADPGIYVTWSGRTGTAAYGNGLLVTLTASPNASSSFGGWSGAGCTGTQACFVTMDADKSVTATFNPLSNARIGGTPYGTLGDAYDAVAGGGIIEAKAIVFAEDLTLDQGKDFLLRGGFADDYSGQTGYTTLNGVLSVDTGSVDVDRLIIGYLSGSTL
jgi:hypothetical protein